MYEDDAKLLELINVLAERGAQRAKMPGGSKSLLVRLGVLTHAGRPTPEYRDLFRRGVVATCRRPVRRAKLKLALQGAAGRLRPHASA